MSDPEGGPRIEPVIPAPTCPRCARDLLTRVESYVGGRIAVALVCSVHGAFPRGWRPKFLDHTRAQRWAARERARQERQRQRR